MFQIKNEIEEKKNNLSKDSFLVNFSRYNIGTNPIKIKIVNPFVGQDKPSNNPETTLSKR